MIIAEVVPRQEGVPEKLKVKTEKSRVVVLFFSTGVRVMQSFLPPNQVPPTKLKDYRNISDYKEIKKKFISVNINGIEGIASPPLTFINPYGVKERKPGKVTWYDKPILYTVYGDGHIPLKKLIKIARLFN